MIFIISQIFKNLILIGLCLLQVKLKFEIQKSINLGSIVKMESKAIQALIKA